MAAVPNCPVQWSVSPVTPGSRAISLLQRNVSIPKDLCEDGEHKPHPTAHAGSALDLRTALTPHVCQPDTLLIPRSCLSANDDKQNTILKSGVPILKSILLPYRLQINID